MGIIPSRNLEEQRREENGVTYFDRGVIEGKDGRKYSRYASTAMAAVTELPKIASKAVRKEILVNSLIESPRSGR